MKEISRILVAGGGMMGKNIAFVFTKNPAYRVGVYDMKAVDVAAGIRQNTVELVEKGVLEPAELEERLSRISFTTDPDSPLLSEADLVVEAVFEDMDVKRSTFAMLEERCREDTIFCTNSSVMSPSLISRDLKKRARFVGTHFWNPGHLIPLVEVVMSDATDEETAQTVMQVLSGVGKEPVLCRKDVPGFIANRMQHALWREAISIVEEGRSSRTQLMLDRHNLDAYKRLNEQVKRILRDKERIACHLLHAVDTFLRIRLASSPCPGTQGDYVGFSYSFHIYLTNSLAKSYTFCEVVGLGS